MPLGRLRLAVLAFYLSQTLMSFSRSIAPPASLFIGCPEVIYHRLSLLEDSILEQELEAF